MVSSPRGRNEGLSGIWDESGELSLSILTRVLKIQGVVTDAEASELQRFNSMRNKIVHDLFDDPYDGEPKRVLKSEFDAVFKLGMGLDVRLSNRFHEIEFGADRADPK